MSLLQNIFGGLRGLFGKERAERELDEELRGYVEAAADAKIKGGMSSVDALRAARLELGGAESVKEEVRAAGWEYFADTLWQDIRFGARMLRKSPGFTTVAILTLALGIGANTAIFSLVDAVLYKMLPVQNPQQLVRLVPKRPDQNAGNFFFSYPTFQQLQARNEVFSGVLAFGEMNLDVDAEVNGQPDVAKGQVVSGSYYPTLGVPAITGRLIAPEDDHVGSASVAVISYSYWTRRFNRDASIVGKAIKLNGWPFTIVGVTPPEFFGLQPGVAIDISVPITTVAMIRPDVAMAGTPYSFLTAPFRSWLSVMARLKPGVNETAALADLAPTFTQANQLAANSLAGLPFDTGDTMHYRQILLETRLGLEPGSRGLTALRDQFSKPLLALMAIVGLLLLTACANVANLLLVRANSRRKEVALRLALGSGRVRLLRQLLTESAVLAAGGACVGLLLAFWGVRFLLDLISHSPQPVFLKVAPDIGVLSFTVFVSILSVIAFGAVPAWRASGLDPYQAIRETASSIGTGRRSSAGNALVLTQVTLSLVVLMGAGLLVRTLKNLRDLNPGFEKDNVLLFSVNPGMVGYKAPQLTSLYQRLLEQTRAIPGVRAASFSAVGPLSRDVSDSDALIEGYKPRPGENTDVEINPLGPGYFGTLGTRLVVGREFTDGDRAGATKVAVINEAMSRHFFGDENPLGRRFSIPGYMADPTPLEIVGVVRNTKYHSLKEEIPPAAYIPFFQFPIADAVTIEVQTASEPDGLVPSVRSVLQNIDGRLPLFDVRTLNEQIDESLIQERLVASLSTLFGLTALALTSIGLYGLMAYLVVCRTHEFGIRSALGATSGSIKLLIVSYGMRLTLSGIVVGLAIGVGATRFLSKLLYGILPNDLLTLAMASLLMSGVALLACYIPALRATKVDPMVALRHE